MPRPQHSDRHRFVRVERSCAPGLRLAAFGPLVCALGCTQVLDFDRSKIDDTKPSMDPSTSGDGGRDSGKTQPDAGPDAAAHHDGGHDGRCSKDTDCRSAERPECVDHVCEPCDPGNHDGCDGDRLCCEASTGLTCLPTSLAACEACGVACNSAGAPESADRCVDRSCQCGANAACDPRAPADKCYDADGNAGQGASCVECETFADCTGPAKGPECVHGACAQCDPGADLASSIDDKGCSGNKPICNPDTLACEACSNSPDNCAAPTTCDASGACVGCTPGTNAGCGGTKPLCLETSTGSGKYMCRACSGDASCGGAQCLASGECAPCDPADDAGCSAGLPFCKLANSVYSCQACTALDCAASPSPVCAVSGANTGRCVQCAADSHCTDPAKPLCSNNTCVPCNTGGLGGTDARCSALGRGVCVRSGAKAGYCAECDPSDHEGCLSSQLCCYASGNPTCQPATASTQCTACGVACTGEAVDTCTAHVCGCGSGGACAGANDTCVAGNCRECNSDDDCTSAAAPLCSGNVCVACNDASIATGANTRCATKRGGTGLCALNGTSAGSCTACDPGPDGSDPADDVGCMMSQACNTTTYVCQ